MKKHKVLIVCMSLIIIICVAVSPLYVSALSKLGSRGTEVTNIQKRLIEWGYMQGPADGIYGTKTESAVKAFQKNNGLTVDGVAGRATLSKMGLPTGEVSGSAGSSSDANINLLARVINGEARGEPYEGQVAVGAVILNRVKHSSFPNSIAGVIYQEGAFTAIVDGQINAEMYDSCYKAARDAMNGWDPTGGAIYYYNPSTATNGWIWSRPVIKQIGKHVFCL